MSRPATKGEFRLAAQKERDALAVAARADAAVAVAQGLAALPELQNAQLVATYAATKGELDPNGFRALLDPMPMLAFPRVDNEHPTKLAMVFHPCEPEALESGTFNIPEPAALLPMCDLVQVDAILLPGLAFDKGGNRLGYGKGYYDRLLAGRDPGAPHQVRGGLVASQKSRAGSLSAGMLPPLIGITYDETLYEKLPAEPHDIRATIVVTPTQTIRL